MNTWGVLAFFSLVISLVAVASGAWALLKQQVVVDQQGNVSEIEIPFLGKVKTNYPSVIAIFFGIVLVAFVIDKATVVKDTIPLIAALSVENIPGSPQVFVGAIPSAYFKVGNMNGENENEYRMSVERSGEYSVIAFALTQVRDGQPIYSLVQGPARLDAENEAMMFNGTLSGLSDPN